MVDRDYHQLWQEELAKNGLLEAELSRLRELKEKQQAALLAAEHLIDNLLHRCGRSNPVVRDKEWLELVSETPKLLQAWKER